MIAGRQVLTSIDQSIDDAQKRIDALDSRIEAVTGELANQEQAMAEDYRELARVRLDRFMDGELEEHLDRTEQQVASLFTQRQEARSALQHRISETANRLQSLSADRERQLKQVDRDSELVDGAESETQRRLEKNPDYIQQREKAEGVNRQAMHAEEKAARSEAERERKGEAYRNDPLFMYLWQRNYGLPNYRAFGLFRWLDDKVARMIGFSDARANYTRLNEIPKRLSEHANSIRMAAEKEFAALRALDEAAREADGIPQLEKTLERSQAGLDAIDEQIAEAELGYQALQDQKTAFTLGEDEYTQRALAYLAAELKRDDLMELRYDAVHTPFPDDDLIVNRMLDREHRRQDLEETVRGFKETIKQHRQRLTELETLRVDFKQQRYDRAGSTFKDDSIIGMVLSQFVAGMLDRGMLWKILREQQRYRPRRSNPDFGSGGFGRGTVWSGGLGDVLKDLGGSGFPRRRGGGGFGRRGGGGFGRGGGGFRTGGGF